MSITLFLFLFILDTTVLGSGLGRWTLVGMERFLKGDLFFCIYSIFLIINLMLQYEFWDLVFFFFFNKQVQGKHISSG